jgi:hypothetical protein
MTSNTKNLIMNPSVDSPAYDYCIFKEYTQMDSETIRKADIIINLKFFNRLISLCVIDGYKLPEEQINRVWQECQTGLYVLKIFLIVLKNYVNYAKKEK